MRQTTTIINPDGSSVVTDVMQNGAGTVALTRTVTTTSADGLTKTVSSFTGAATDPHKTITSARVLNSNDSITETVTTYACSALAVTARAVTEISADRMTSTTSTYVGTNTNPETVATTTTAPDGSRTETVSGYGIDGSVLLGRTVTTRSADNGKHRLLGSRHRSRSAGHHTGSFLLISTSTSPTSGFSKLCP